MKALNQLEKNVINSAVGKTFGHLLMRHDSSLDRDELRLKRVVESLLAKCPQASVKGKNLAKLEKELGI